MRQLTIAAGLLLLVLQWPLWLGKGGWLRVWDLERQIEAKLAANEKVAARNAVLMAEIQSMKEGREAIEERARGELNMVRADEIFFQLVPPSSGAASVPKLK